MYSIKIITLIDISRPRVSRPGQGTELEQNQYKNWVTLLQCVGLRSNIEYDNDPQLVQQNISQLGFGKKYSGLHKTWIFTFRPDRNEAYMDESGNLIGLLISDLHQVPIVKNLTETINISKAVLDLNSLQTCNTIVHTVADSD